MSTICPTRRSPARSAAVPPPSVRCSAAAPRRCARPWRLPLMDELLAPLAPEEPTDDEIRRLLARADRRTRRRRIRIATATSLAAVAAVATLAALPGAPQAPLTAHSLLPTTAAVAADQPSPSAWTGYRYIHDVELRAGDGYT